ncbi:adenosylhomocysteinase [Desulfitispora alkaliphila]|uniref:adenosylhomocysteinase n=1 Tax=Desulfitispora alkaliphila TaxID=622674 RepID=UPI003D1FDDFC
MKSKIRDINLAPMGKIKIDWVKEHMPVLNELREDFVQKQIFANKKIVMCMHLEAKTAYLARIIHEAGGDLTVVASNPLSTQDDVVAALVEEGITAFAWHGATDSEYQDHIKSALACEPDLIIDDGGDLVATLHTSCKEYANNLIGGTEETTTGVLRLKSMAKEGELNFPVIAVNDAFSKYLFDNRYGTGQSVWDGIMRTTNLVVAGKTVVVNGYGWCGKGIAMRAKGLGAKVIVTEIDTIKANEAIMDGFSVMPMIEAAKFGDFFVTVTGNKDVIRKEHLEVIKDKAIMCNAGHFDVEISKKDLNSLAVKSRLVRDNVQEFTLEDGRIVYLLAEGRLVNLASGDGHPAEIMDMSFALQALSLRYVLENHDKMGSGVHDVPDNLDERVAALRLKALGIEIDTLTPEQEKYLNSWQE